MKRYVFAGHGVEYARTLCAPHAADERPAAQRDGYFVTEYRYPVPSALRECDCCREYAEASAAERRAGTQ